jgi:hypothetical protein
MRLPGAYRGLPRPSSASEPSYPPNGVACRAYSRTQYPASVWLNRLYTAIIVITHYALHLKALNLPGCTVSAHSVIDRPLIQLSLQRR